MSYDEPTRVMRRSGGERASSRSGGGAGRGPRRPVDQQMGRLRLIIACLCAVIVGLLIALIAGGGGDEAPTATVTETVQATAGDETATTPTTPDQTDSGTGDDAGDSGGFSPDAGGDGGEADGGEPDTGADTGGESPLPDVDLGGDESASGGISPGQ